MNTADATCYGFGHGSRVPLLALGPREEFAAIRRSGDRPGAARELQDVQPGVGAIDQIDEAALVGLDVVALDRGLALVLSVHLEAARVGVRGDRRDEEAVFLRPVGSAPAE